MNIQEAYKTLEVQENISDADLKKSYKELARNFHPDLYKEDPNKFKTINEAYQLIKDYRENPAKYQPQSQQGFQGGFGGFNMNDIFSTLFQQNMEGDQGAQINFPPIKLNASLTFEESILGCNREFTYKKYKKCDDCEGKGLLRQSNGCKECNGFGRKVTKQGNSVYSSSCSKCMGRGVKSSKCTTCNGKCGIESDSKINITIPPGVQSDNVLRMSGMGSFAGESVFSQSAYSDAFLIIEVKKDKELKLEDKDVVSNLNISLLEALEGVDERKVRTAYGEKPIKIPPLTKNADQVRLEGCGVRGTNGSQRVVINIQYPENIDTLINALKEGS